MDADSIISLVTNVGFPVAMCFILLKYVLQTLVNKLDQIDISLKELNSTIKNVNRDQQNPPEK